MALGSISDSIYGRFGKRRRKRVGALPGGSREPTRYESYTPPGLIGALYGATGQTPPGSAPGPTGGGQAPTGGAQAPFTPPTAWTPPRTFNPAYDEGMAGLKGRYDRNANSYLGGANQLAFETGFNSQGKELTAADALYNPFNRMAMLRQSFQRANQAQVGGMASRGQLYSGALQSRLDNQRGRYDESESGLKSSTSGAYRGLLEAWLAGVDEITADKAGLTREDRDFQTSPENAFDWDALTPGQRIRAAAGLDPFDTSGDTHVATGPGGATTQGRPPRPSRDPKPGYRWRFVNGKWVQRRRQTVGSFGDGTRR